MSAFPSAPRRSKLPLFIALVLIVVAALGGGAVYLWPRFESEPPQISVSPAVDVLGTSPLEIQITDRGTGLKAFKATLSQGSNEISLASEPFALALALAGLERSPWLAAPLALLPMARRLQADFASLPAGPAFNLLLFRTVKLELAFGGLLVAGALLRRTAVA